MNKIFIAAVVPVLLFAGCIKSDLDKCPEEPEPGVVTITTDWSNIGEGIPIPSDYTVIMDNYSTVLSGATNTLDALFDTGTYPLLVYNNADNITVTGNQASVTAITPPEGVSGAFISPGPGWFFSSSMEVEVEEEGDNHFTAVMNQHIGELTLELEPEGGSADNISGITGWLSGVASVLDMSTGQVSNAANVPLVFTLDPVDGKWKATIYILGVTGSEQILTTSIDFSDGTPSQQAESDMSEALEGFNANKTNFPPLEGIIIKTPTGSGFTVTINGWQPGNGPGGNETAS